MEGLVKGEKRRWVFAAVAAGAIGASGLTLFRQPVATDPGGSAAGQKRSVTLISPQDTAVNDEAVLLDPTPLFLPTKWNATQRAIAPREAGGKFQGFDTPTWNFAENELKLGLPAPIAVPESIAEAVLADAPSVPLVGVGRSDAQIERVVSRKGFIEVFAANSGRAVFKTSLVEGPAGAAAWQPLEFIAAVDPAGLSGPLVLTVRSGVDEVDGFFAGYIAKMLRLGEILAPGLYRISIGP
jgi:hypothetical protein